MEPSLVSETKCEVLKLYCNFIWTRIESRWLEQHLHVLVDTAAQHNDRTFMLLNYLFVVFISDELFVLLQWW